MVKKLGRRIRNSVARHRALALANLGAIAPKTTRNKTEVPAGLGAVAPKKGGHGGNMLTHYKIQCVLGAIARKSNLFSSSA